VIEAQIHRTPDSDFTADALRTILYSDRKADLYDKRAASQRLVQILLSSSTTCKDVRLFEKFRQLVWVMFHRANPSQRYAALLDLAHPTRPSAGSYLRFLRNDSFEIAEYINEAFDPTSLREAEGLAALVYQVARVCLVEGRREDATWMLSFAHSKRPQFFETTAIIESYLRELEAVHANRKIPYPKRHPTASEIEAGVDIDEDGRTVLSSKLNEALRDNALLRNMDAISGRIR
jgi:hypothetical protein